MRAERSNPATVGRRRWIASSLRRNDGVLEESALHLLEAIRDWLLAAILGAFSPSAPYGAPALGGALLFSALYYAGRRQARGRRTSLKGFVRSVFPQRLLLHPSSLVDMRLWALNGVVFASAYAMLGLGLFWSAVASAGPVNSVGVRQADARYVFLTTRKRAEARRQLCQAETLLHSGSTPKASEC